MTALGAYLRNRRGELALSLRQVEKATDGAVSNAYLSQIETGKVDSPSVLVLHRLAKALSLDFNELLEIAVGDRVPAVLTCPTCGQPL